MTATWSRYSTNGYECSSTGDKRFSAFYAKSNNGKTIEEVYQLDIKGYRSVSNDLMSGKGKPPLCALTRQELYLRYRDLWCVYFEENPDLLLEIMEISKTKVLTDRFASSEINQARAIVDICNFDELLLL
jgi:hypothetical protein